MGFILTNAREKVSNWDGVKFTVPNVAATRQFTDIKTAMGRAYDKATGLTTSVSDGQAAWFKVIYINQQQSTDYATFIGTYEDSDDSITPVAGSIVDASNGLSMPDFSTDSDVLFIYGVNPAESFGIRTLQEDFDTSLTPIGFTTSTSFIQATSNDITVTPKSNTSRLVCVYNARIDIKANGSSTTSAFGTVKSGYYNSTNVYTLIGNENRVGWALWSSDTNNVAYHHVTFRSELDSTHVDLDGDWRIAPAFKTGNSNYAAQLVGIHLHYREIL